MEKKIKKRLSRMLIISVVVIVLIFVIGQIVNAGRTYKKNAREKLITVQNTIEANKVTISRLTENVGANNLAKTRAVAEIIAADPTRLENKDFLANLSAKIDANCICVIDGNGIIEYCDNPGYLGYDMGSADQSKVFNEILTNPNLEIVQEPMENGTLGIIFQYIGVSRLDGPGYVQIELKPTVLQETLADTALDKVLGEMDFENTGFIFAIDKSTGAILACNNKDYIGQDCTQYGLKTTLNGEGSVKFDNVKYWYYANEYDGKVIGVMYPTADYLKSVFTTVALVAISLGILSVVLRSFILNFIKKDVVKGIMNIKESVVKIAEGDLTIKVSEISQEEFSQLSTAINQMVDNIKAQLDTNNRMVSDVKGVCGHLSLISKDIYSTAVNIADGNTEQQKTVEDMKQKMAVLSSNLSQASANAKDISQSNMDAVDELSEASGQFDELSESMNEITNTSNAIGKIIREIDDIAFQTNLLALNASVEAARAGEMGKGFAVVAQEFGVLAARTSKASKESEELISNSLRAVNKGNEIKNKTVDAFLTVITHIKDAANAVREMSSEVASQMDLVQDAEMSLCRINEVVEANAAVANESEATAQNMAEEANALLSMVDR